MSTKGLDSTNNIVSQTKTQVRHLIPSSTITFHTYLQALKTMLNITAVGNLGQDPELKQVSNSDVAEFSLAVKSGRDQTTWLRCNVWGKRSEVVMRFFTKGSRVTISGKGNLRTYQAKDGTQKSSLDVSVDDFTLPEKPQEKPTLTFNNDDSF